ncbi:unnamed protein product [Clonostachys rosea f. rosea IK726]|uniref:PH-response regulator protein palI/RIM9 n=2 Tax=Bionectria ochroleuca TaxID=29856 RepID=A0A0B7KDG7_BIOOC|nr:unnamed protein product [Clonostachys rosea f. rosea IK726]
MLRPATPLSVMLFAALALQVLAVISTPVIKAIPLGSFGGYSFGVFGYCDAKSKCSSISIGYKIGSVSDDKDFDMPRTVRETLTMILILHPVAAGLTLLMFILAVTSHFHSPAHSGRFLLAFSILIILTFLVSLAAFLMDVLVFIPHIAWGSYLVLASTILLLISLVVSCVIRKTMLGRKSRRRQVAENAEMSGENFYNREAALKPIESTFSAPVPPTTTAQETLPTFATFEQKAADTISDERIPLTQRSPSTSSPAPMNPYNRSMSPRDQFNNSPSGPPDAYGIARGPSNESMRSRGSQRGAYRGRGGYGRGGMDMYGGGGSMRGRGGYGPPGRGGYPPRGGPRGGGLAPPPRGAYAGGMRGGRSPPPGPYNGNGPYDRRPSPGYNNNQPAAGEVSPISDGFLDNSLPRAESPPPLPDDPALIGRAVDMPQARATPPQGYGQLRDNDSDVAGMVGLQQGMAPPNRHETYMSVESKYSTDEQYMPARAAWNQTPGRGSPMHGGPAPGAAKSDYYEDVDPRFEGRQSSNVLPPAGEPAYEDARAHGARSPTGSERSNFTSISQRGVNPRWEAPPPMPHQHARRQVQQRQDMLLDNPDFQVPGSRPGPRNGPGTVPGSAYPGGGF